MADRLLKGWSKLDVEAKERIWGDDGECLIGTPAHRTMIAIWCFCAACGYGRAVWLDAVDLDAVDLGAVPTHTPEECADTPRRRLFASAKALGDLAANPETARELAEAVIRSADAKAKEDPRG